MVVVGSGAGGDVTFDPEGSGWLPWLCVVFVLVAGLFLGGACILAGVAKRRLWGRMRAEPGGPERWGEEIGRLGLAKAFGSDEDLGRFRRTRPWRVGMGEFALGLVLASVGVGSFAAVWLEAPQRLAWGGAEFVVDYPWPRADRRGSIGDVRRVEVRKTLWRGRRGTGRSETVLRLGMASGEEWTIEPPMGAKSETLRAAAKALAERAGVRVEETVYDRR